MIAPKTVADNHVITRVSPLASCSCRSSRVWMDREPLSLKSRSLMVFNNSSVSLCLASHPSLVMYSSVISLPHFWCIHPDYFLYYIFYIARRRPQADDGQHQRSQRHRDQRAANLLPICFLCHIQLRPSLGEGVMGVPGLKNQKTLALPHTPICWYMPPE